MVEAHTFYKQDLMKLNLQTVRFFSRCHKDVKWTETICQRTVLNRRRGWLIAAGINFSSTTSLRFADLEGLPSNNTMGPVNARPLQDVKLNHSKGN